MSTTATETEVRSVQLKTTLLAPPPFYTAAVTTWGQPPKFIESSSHSVPPPDHVEIRVTSAALHSLVRGRASGRHYSVKTLPHIPGVDGVGTTTDGREVYFHTLGTSAGSFSEIVHVPAKDVCALPPGLNKHQVAALLNPVMSSHMAIRKRATNLPANFTVLILGATSMSGKLAIIVSRLLGAGKVIGCARNEEKLAALDLDQTIVLQADVENTDFRAAIAAGDVDLVLDYLWGPPALALLSSLPTTHRTQWSQIGALAGNDVALPCSVIRSRRVELQGSGIGSWTLDDLHDELPRIVDNMRHIPRQHLNIVPLREIEAEWGRKSVDRTVFMV